MFENQYLAVIVGIWHDHVMLLYDIYLNEPIFVIFMLKIHKYVNGNIILFCTWQWAIFRHRTTNTETLIKTKTILVSEKITIPNQ